eukprot:TRINITY_DN20109_c2_g1_i1.p1 TRINITY_DN20109_c2_g1~~TRINITY_DN20109_c2_g1_i1.p1  ORF type:complete len:241 (+),score=-20.87 TRINITY_DN20109_c2_g1_i1:589-1311(+)
MSRNLETLHKIIQLLQFLSSFLKKWCFVKQQEYCYCKFYGNFVKNQLYTFFCKIRDSYYLAYLYLESRFFILNFALGSSDSGLSLRKFIFRLHFFVCGFQFYNVFQGYNNYVICQICLNLGQMVNLGQVKCSCSMNETLTKNEQLIQLIFCARWVYQVLCGPKYFHCMNGIFCSKISLVTMYGPQFARFSEQLRPQLGRKRHSTLQRKCKNDRKFPLCVMQMHKFVRRQCTQEAKEFSGK